MASHVRNVFGAFEKRAPDLVPGVRFSKAPKTFRACEAIFNCLYLENKEACRHKTLQEGQLYS